MNTTYKVIVVIAAIGVISVIQAMTSSINTIGNSTRNMTEQKLLSEPLQDTVLHSYSRYSEKQSNNQSNGLINIGDKHSTVKIVQNIYENDGGSFYLEKENEQAGEAQQYIQVPLLNSHFEVSVVGNIVRTKVEQRFQNESALWQNGVYVFPLPHDAAVDAMLMQVDERKIEGVIKQKAKAKAAFEQAKSEGKSASLVSQLRPNMFVNRIANIAPESEIVVTIEYQQVLTKEGQQYSLRIPSSITPRYTPSSHSKAAQNDAEQHDAQQINETSEMALINQSHEPYSELSIDININMGTSLVDIISEYHPIRIEPPIDAEQNYRVTLVSEHANDQEFVLNWQRSVSSTPSAIHLTETQGDFQYGVIQIVPAIAPTNTNTRNTSKMPHNDVQTKRELTFILDTSGSMVGEAIEQASAALNTAIDDLHAEDKFNIIEFNSKAKNLWQNGQVASDENKKFAKHFVNSLQASGGTEMSEALRLAFSLNNHENKNEVLQQILFITDGSVSNEAELLALINENLQEQRLFTVGIGSAPNVYFMNEAAIAGRGTFTLIGDLSQVNTKMTALLNKIKLPALTDIKLMLFNNNDGMLEAGQNNGFQMFPNKIPDVYAGEPITLSYRFERRNSQFQNTDITLQAILANNASDIGAAMLWQSKLPSTEFVFGSGISKNWAYEKIQQLTRSLNTTSKGGEDYLTLKQYTDKTITELALHHQLVSSQTSLIAVDEQVSRPSSKYLAMLKSQNGQQNQTNKQWRAAHLQLPKTSTLSDLYIWLGIFFTVSSSVLLILFGRR